MLVRDLVEDPELRLDLLVSGDLDRRIRWVHTIEVADPGRFLRGGEVVLSAGVWRSADVAPADFVASLAAADVAALGYGPLDGVPQSARDAVVKAAGEYGLTCFFVPPEIAFIQIVETFVTERRGEWELPLRRNLAIHDRMVAALSVERGTAGVLRVVAQQLGLPVRLAEPGSGGIPVMGEATELLTARPTAELDVEQLAVIAQAVPFLALELERERAVRSAEQRYAEELLDWAYAGPPYLPSVEARLRTLGLPTSFGLAGAVIRGTDPLRLAQILGPDAALAQRRTSKAGADQGEVVAIIKITDADVGEFAAGLRQRLETHAVLGIGRPGSAAELRASLLQAEQAADQAERDGSSFHTYRDLNSPLLLFTSQDPDLLTTTCKALLQPVLDHDERHGGDLMATLCTFLETGGRWQEAAGRLHVHINTLRHRIGRVEELTGRDLGRTADRVDLFLALRALGLL